MFLRRSRWKAPRNKAEAVVAEDAARTMAALASGKEPETGDAPLKPDYGRQGIQRSTYRGRVHHSSHQIRSACTGRAPTSAPAQYQPHPPQPDASPYRG